MRMFVCLIMLMPAICLAQTLVGQWTFDNPNDLLNATTGNDLELVGTHTIVPGPDTNDGAVNIGEGSYYKANHGIPANGGGTMVNEYSVVIDFKVASIGQWYTFMQTYYPNTNDGDCFINLSGQIGVAATGYSAYSVMPDEWYRLVIAIDLGSSYKYYLDGQLLKDGTNQTVDGRFSIYPANPTQPFLFFADENGEDNPINVAYCAMYDGCLSAAQVNTLGGYGHSVLPPSAEMLPYLQTPTPTSMYISWHGASSDESRVEYGTSNALEMSQTGIVYTFNSTTKWHNVKLENLIPDTEYFYQCHTGSQSSAVSAFRTPPQIGSREGHFRFLIMGDSQSNAGVSANIVNHVVTKLTELYGTDWHNDVQLLCHVGDMVGNGANLSSYITEHFIPFSPLSAKIPIMESIGNHEAESSYYYNYRKYEDFGGSEGEKYYHFDIGSMRFIFLNPNILTTFESIWLQNKINEAQANPNQDWIFAFSHMPAYSEIWPDGNNSWAQNVVLPYLASAEKAAILAGGHSHNYERGFAPTGRLTTLISGGAGGALDRWEMYPNQDDYLNTIKSLDHYHWILVDVDLENHSYDARMFSLGHPDLVRNNEVMDEWNFNGQTPPLEIPTAIAQTAAAGNQLRLVAGQNYATDEPLSTRFQLASDLGFSNVLADATRHATNVYGDTNSPLWIPTDLNAGIDIFRYDVATGILTEGNTYHWRVQTRNQNLQWSAWSQPRTFEMLYQPPVADFTTLSPMVYVGEPACFFETSVGDATSFAWDFETDGIIDSNERDPVWTFQQHINYNVTLTVMINGQSYSVTKQIDVVAVSNQDNLLPVPDVKMTIYPNPFSGITSININLPKAGKTSLCIFNAKGQFVKDICDKSLPKGQHEYRWDGKDNSGNRCAEGIYLCVFKSDNSRLSRKIVLLK